MNERFLNELIDIGECEYVDFKREFHSNNASLVHDILCLTNSYAPHNRYLIFGIEDNGQKVGVAGDVKRKKSADIQDLIRASGFNRLPDVKMHVVISGPIEIDVLEIANRPDKPFYLLSDKIEGKERVRSGVVYTRLGDTNTPKNECASEERVELMWRERFGVRAPPLDRVKKLLFDRSDWIFPNEYEGHHRIFPEFSIHLKISDDQNIIDSWVENFRDKSFYRKSVDIRYFGTLLRSLEYVICDGGRYYIPIPNIRSLGASGAEYYLLEDSLEYALALVFNSYLEKLGESYWELLNNVGIEVR